MILSEHLILHGIRILCKGKSRLASDLLSPVKFKDCIIHRDHTLLSVGLHIGNELMALSLTDKVSYGAVDMEHLKSCDSGHTIVHGNKLL